MVGSQAYYFPEADEPAMAPLAIAFARMMFAHAALEAEVRTFQSAIIGDPTFGEHRVNQWDTKRRPRRMAALIRKHFGDVPEAAATADLLKQAVQPSHQRNLYAHGEWWRFDPQTGIATVRQSTIRAGEPKHVDFTAADLDLVTETLKDIEGELFQQRRAIEEMRRNG